MLISDKFCFGRKAIGSIEVMAKINESLKMSSKESVLSKRKKQNIKIALSKCTVNLCQILSTVGSIWLFWNWIISFVTQVQTFDKLKNKGANIWLLEIWLQKCFTFLWSGLALHREQQATNPIKTAPKMLLSCICHLFPIKRVDVCLQHKHLSLSKSVHTTCLFYTS